MNLSEHNEQRLLMLWADKIAEQDQRLSMLFSIPNGSFRNKTTGHRLKQEGVKPGVPDLCLPVPANGYHGLFIELKRTGKHTTSEAQIRWLHDLNQQGYLATVCVGWKKAADEIISYLQPA